MDKFSVPKITYSRKSEEQGLIYESTNPPTYDELLGKIAGMCYESPIDIVVGEMQFKFEQDVMKAIQSYDIGVDRDELIKALQYDRHQYEKGFADACKLNTKGEWISVEDRLPTYEDGKVLIYTAYGMSIAERTTSNRWRGDCAIPKLITHWMPLPEAPKMKGGE